MSDRCTGHCCRAFSLPYSLEQMKVEYKRDLARIENGDILESDFVKVYPMLIPLSTQPGRHPDGPARQSNERYYYTCRHFKDGNCTNYEHRPRMCRNYLQYKDPSALCEYAGCTWDMHHGLRPHSGKLRVLTGDCPEHQIKAEKLQEGTTS